MTERDPLWLLALDAVLAGIASVLWVVYHAADATRRFVRRAFGWRWR